jgi:hypothetical protein
MPNGEGRYVPYSTSVEVKQPNEDQDIQSCLEVLKRMQVRAHERHRYALRGAHAKSHGLVKGELKIYENLPEELRQGIAKAPTTYPVIIRFSTSPPDIYRDAIAAYRGFAIKLIGVPGKKLHPEPNARDAVTQDFILANGKNLPTVNVSAYLKQVYVGDKLMSLPQSVAQIATIGMRAVAATLRAFGSDYVGGCAGQALPLTHILGNSFYTTAPVRFGDYVAKLNVEPVSDSLKALRGVPTGMSNQNVLRDMVVEFFRKNSVEYEFRAQLCTDLKRMPVEDGSVEWPEDESPYRAFGKITIPAQEAYTPTRRVYVDDVLSWSPWHCIEEHQPLGSLMRVRRQVYFAASAYRHKMNAMPLTEPTSIDEIPD